MVARSILRFVLGKRAGSEFAQYAITFPMMALLTVGMLNLAYLGYVNQAATNIANAGARAGSVHQQAPAAAAYAAANNAAATAGMSERVSVTVAGGGFPGARIVVTVNWNCPSLLGMIGINNFSGATYSVFRQEGW